MANTKNIASKDILARLLAGENLTVIHCAKADTASFDTRDRVLTLPVWENMTDSMYDMLIGHEVGHALYTPWTERDEAANGIAAAYDIGGKNPATARVAMDYLNVVEDVRIERMIQESFPGLRRDFFAAYTEMIEQDFFGIKGKNVADLPFIDRLNVHFKTNNASARLVKFNAEEQVFVDKIASASTFDEVVTVAQDLFAYCGNKKNDNQDQGDQEQVQVDSNLDSADQGDQEQNPDQSPSNKSNNAQTSGASGENTPTDLQGEKGAGKTPSTNNPSQSHGASQMNPTPAAPTTTKALSDNIQKSHGSKSKVSLTIELDTPIIANIIHPYNLVMNEIEAHINAFRPQMPASGCAWAKSGAEYMESQIKALNSFLAETAPTVSYMVKQFEMKKAAQVSQRTRVSRSGVIDPVRMSNYKIMDDIFRSSTSVEAGKNHGIVLFLDWSSSMAPILQNTAKQLILISMFCKKVGIPFEVYAFSSVATIKKDIVTQKNGYGSVDSKSQWTRNGNENTILSARMSPFCLINLLSSKMKNTEFKRGLSNFWALVASCSNYSDGSFTPREYGLGSTPLDESIVAAMTIVPKFREANNLQIVNTIFLTDGESSACSRISEMHYHSVPGVTSNFIIDPKTRKSFKVTKHTTDTLIEILRDNAKTNVIGFHLIDRKNFPQWMAQTFDTKTHSYCDVPGADEMRQSWTKNGYFHSPFSGYNEHYVIQSVIEDPSSKFDQLTPGVSATRIVNAMIKDAAAVSASRAIFGRMIDLIAR